MVLLFYTFNEMKFSGLWNHSDFITLVTGYQPQNSHSSNAPGFRGEEKGMQFMYCILASQYVLEKSPPLLKNN